MTEESNINRGLVELIGRSLTDNEFRNLLFDEREKALEGYTLSEKDLIAVSKLDLKKLEDTAKKIGDANSITIAIGISISF